MPLTVSTRPFQIVRRQLAQRRLTAPPHIIMDHPCSYCSPIQLGIDGMLAKY